MLEIIPEWVQLVLTAITSFLIGVIGTLSVKVKFDLNDWLKERDKQRKERDLYKIQAKCSHQWSFTYPYNYGLCCLCGLKAPVEMVAAYYPDQFAKFKKHLNIRVMGE